MPKFKDKEPINKELYKEVAEEMEVPVSVVKNIITQGQSKFTVFVMSNNSFDSVRWPYLGTFKASIKGAMMLAYRRGLTKEQRKFFTDQEKLKKMKRKQKKK